MHKTSQDQLGRIFWSFRFVHNISSPKQCSQKWNLDTAGEKCVPPISTTLSFLQQPCASPVTKQKFVIAASWTSGSWSPFPGRALHANSTFRWFFHGRAHFLQLEPPTYMPAPLKHWHNRQRITFQQKKSLAIVARKVFNLACNCMRLANSGLLFCNAFFYKSQMRWRSPVPSLPMQKKCLSLLPHFMSCRAAVVPRNQSIQRCLHTKWVVEQHPNHSSYTARGPTSREVLHLLRVAPCICSSYPTGASMLPWKEQTISIRFRIWFCEMFPFLFHMAQFAQFYMAYCFINPFEKVPRVHHCIAENSSPTPLGTSTPQHP